MEQLPVPRTRACAVDKAAEQLRHGSRVVRDLQRRLQNSMEAFRESLRAKSAEMQQRHAEMWQDRQGELQGYAEDFQRRLEELKASQRREADHVQQSTEQSVLQMRRMHEAEMSSWQMQALNRRSERIHRLEHEFAEERRLKEQAAQNAEHELAQVQKDLLDFKASYRLVDQQVDSLRGTLEEMRRRAHQAQKDADQAFEEANQAEANIATLAQDIAMLEVRRGSDSPTAVLPPKPPKPKPPRAPGLTEELREAIASHKHLEAELAQLEAQLGDLEDELAEKDKTVEILEVETEEERLRTHRLQARILQLEQALS
ncbi:unnamed protein product [Effrenium voratum]|uniref:Uncharacterized protein n=1 Tax=Effrenium voratum TaxID=2562239 RepID=A0AA36IVQ1_9DINO|nr:unnamed protein product [Effrenium voratum]